MTCSCSDCKPPCHREVAAGNLQLCSWCASDHKAVRPVIPIDKPVRCACAAVPDAPCPWAPMEGSALCSKCQHHEEPPGPVEPAYVLVDGQTVMHRWPNGAYSDHDTTGYDARSYADLIARYALVQELRLMP